MSETQCSYILHISLNQEKLDSMGFQTGGFGLGKLSLNG
jgi:hypothetical protein